MLAVQSQYQTTFPRIPTRREKAVGMVCLVVVDGGGVVFGETTPWTDTCSTVVVVVSSPWPYRVRSTLCPACHTEMKHRFLQAVRVTFTK